MAIKSNANARSVDQDSDHESMVVSSFGVHEDGAAFMSTSVGPSKSLALQRFVKSPSRLEPWHPQQDGRKRIADLINQVDGMLSAIERMQVGG